MASSYPRKYYSTSYDDLSTIPLVEGNVIATYDADGIYYDIGVPAGSGQNLVRRKARGIEYIAAADLSAHQEPETIFVVNTGTGTDADGNTFPMYSGYIWDITLQDHVNIFNNSTDFQVKSVSNATTQAYIVGSVASTTNVGTLIKNPNIYITSTDNKIHADLEGTADIALQSSHSSTSDIATSATYDNPDNNVTPHKITKYLYDVTSDASTNLGSTLTFTLGDESVKTVRVSDTTYSIFTSSTSGLVPDTSTTVQSDSTGVLLSGSGWLATSLIPAGKDGDGNVITETYYADATFDTNTKDLTLTKGDGLHVTVVPIPYTDTVFDTSDPGLVPSAPSSDASIKFLKGDATWGTITTYQGASVGSAGVAGLVPAAASGETNYFLRGDGDWGTTFDASNDGLVPNTSAATAGDILSTSGWVPQNSTGSNDYNLGNTSNLYLVGAISQAASAQTYADQRVFANSGKLYSNSIEVVNLSDTQSLTNKTYNGYTLGAACEKSVTTSLDSSSPSTNLPTNGAVRGYVADEVDSKLDVSIVADIYDDTSTSYAVGDYRMYDDGNGYALYQCNTAISSPAGSFDDTKWDSKLITGLDTWLSGTLTSGQTSVTLSNAAIKVGSMLEIYTDVYGIEPTNVAVTAGQVVLTFVAQGYDINVKIKVI